MRLLTLTLGAALAPALHLSSPPAPQDSLINRIAWMTGCWAQESPTRLIEEHWMPPRGGSMLGVGRTIRAGALVEYELIVVTERDGQLAYEAHPSGQAVATFLAPSPTDTLVVFENPAHDFPQRVGYRRAGADSLAAWVEGAIGGRNKRIDFTYRRVACDGP